MKLERIHHVAIICSDYQASKHFYVEILGLNIVRETYREERRSYKLDLALAEGAQIELFSFPSAPPRPSRPEALGLRHLSFSVRNLDTWKTYLESKGVVIENIRTDELTHKRFTFFPDPDGLPLEIY